MDESLVLLRRRFCWDMDDILYASLKVQGGPKKARPTFKPEVVDAIHRHIWADQLFYDKYNQSLWNAIKHEEGFDEELALFREQLKVCLLKHSATRICLHFVTNCVRAFNFADFP